MELPFFFFTEQAFFFFTEHTSHIDLQFGLTRSSIHLVTKFVHCSAKTGSTQIRTCS